MDFQCQSIKNLVAEVQANNFITNATLISNNITWEILDEMSVKATFTNAGNTIKATLSFNSDGSLADFISTNRYLSSDGKTYLSYPWSTPVKNFVNVDGRMVPGYAEALWHLPETLYPYAGFNLLEIEYNCKEFVF